MSREEGGKGIRDSAGGDLKPGNQPPCVKARGLVCYWTVRELGMNGTRVVKLKGLDQPAVNRAEMRGGKLTQVIDLRLIK